MIKKLTKNKLFYIYENSKKINGIHGNISGNIDECEISNEDRKKGININDLIL